MQRLADGSLVQQIPASYYAFVGEVVGEVPRDPHDVGLRIRVLEPLSPKTKPGEEYVFYASTYEGAACEYVNNVPLRTTEYPVGTRIRVVTPNTEIWALHLGGALTVLKAQH
jgi:hypothetical protein